MQPMQILVLGPEGPGRAELAQTLTRLGYVVMSADARGAAEPPRSGDVVMLDLRGEQDGWAGVVERLRADARPVLVVSERPRRLVRQLAGRPAGTMVLSGAESEAGYRVALSVCEALRRSARARAEAAGGTRVRVAAL